MFPFQIDLSKVSYAVAIDIIAPFIPGGVVGLAWAMRHGNLWNYLHDDKALKLVTAAFAIYVIGFVVLYLSIFGVTAIALVALVKANDSLEPWKDAGWRKLAAAFLGPELSPQIDSRNYPLAEAGQAGNFEELQKQISQTHAALKTSLSAESSWRAALTLRSYPRPIWGAPLSSLYVG